MDAKLWIARDENGALYLFTERPTKGNFYWDSDTDFFVRLNGKLFPEIKWTDPEPTKVQIKIIK